MTPGDFLRELEPDLSRRLPGQIAVHAGIRPNAPPHLGTGLTLGAAFLLARLMGDEFHLPVSVAIAFLDNATATVIMDKANGVVFRKPLRRTLSASEIAGFTESNYSSFLQSLQGITGVRFRTSTYSEQQADPTFRALFLHSLGSHGELKWCVSPLSALLLPDRAIGIRALCPRCGFSDRNGETGTLRAASNERAVLASWCREHGNFDCTYDRVEGDFLDLDKIYRNILKEVLLRDQNDSLNVIIKGTDWLNSCRAVDRGVDILRAARFDPGLPAPSPATSEHLSSITCRFFVPILTAESGIKLSKSLIRENAQTYAGLPEWVLQLNAFLDRYGAPALLDLCGKLMQRRQAVCSIHQLMGLGLLPVG